MNINNSIYEIVYYAYMKKVNTIDLMVTFEVDNTYRVNRHI